MNCSCLPAGSTYTETGGSGGSSDWTGCVSFGFALDGCPDVPGIPYVQTLTVDIQLPTGQPNQLSFNLDAYVDIFFGSESRFFYITATNCSALVEGCDDPVACNYNSLVDYNDGSCTYPGCIDTTACNFNSTAGCDDGSCEYLNSCGVCTGNLYTQEFLPNQPSFVSGPVNIDLSVYTGSNLTLEFQTIVPECYT